MRTKIFVFVITLFLILSGLNLVAQGSIFSGGVSHNQFSSSGNIFSGEEQDLGYCPDHLLVQVEPPSETLLRSTNGEMILQNQINNILSFVEGRTSRLYPSLNMAEIKLQGSIGVIDAVEILNQKDEVIHAEPNYLVEVSNIPNDPKYESLWAMDKIDAPGAWDITTGSEEVVVPVMDTGIDYNHPDLKDNIWTSDEGNYGYNAINDSYDPMDDSGHGTHVAGTIGAVGNNEIGVVGMNWNVSLMGVKMLDEEGSGNIGDAIAGMEYILEKKREGENIVATSNSWWGTDRSELLYEAIEQHEEEGILFITSAGNEAKSNGENPSYPANYDLPNIISVAATDQDDELANFSNYGERSVHVGAPGVNIKSTMLDGEYSSESGTSMAAPHVSGLAALLASHNPSYDHNNLKNIILSSVDSTDSLLDRNLVGGRINAASSLRQSPDPDNIRFWVHQPYVATQLRGKTRITISLNDGVNPILGADVRVEFSTGEDPIQLTDDGSGMDHTADDGYYTGGWTPKTSGEVTLNITAQSEEFDFNMTENVTVDVKVIHRETTQRFLRRIISFLAEIGRVLRELLSVSFQATYSDLNPYDTHLQKANISY